MQGILKISCQVSCQVSCLPKKCILYTFQDLVIFDETAEIMISRAFVAIVLVHCSYILILHHANQHAYHVYSACTCMTSDLWSQSAGGFLSFIDDIMLTSSY